MLADTGDCNLRRKSLRQRFWEKVSTISNGPNGCWEWKAARGARGVGLIKRYGNMGPAARVAWELTQGPIGEGLFVCHRCDNPGCCNPRHLFLGTPRDNTQDMIAKGRDRHPRGDDHVFRKCPERVPRGEVRGNVKLTADQVREIRHRASSERISHRQLAKQYAVSRQLVDGIVSRERWQHVP